MQGEDKVAARPELIFALVGAAGIDLDNLSAELALHLKIYGYDVVEIRLSSLLPTFTGWMSQTGATEADRITHLQNIGNSFRSRLADGAALARAGIASIRAERTKRSGSPDQAAGALAYIVRQLKHPAEVDLLREVYGPSFLLVAGHAPQEMRVETLTRRLARGESQRLEFFKSKAQDIILADDKQDDDYGQNTRDAYPKADFFLNCGIPYGEQEIGRFVELLFGHPFRTPSPEEYAMYQASTVSLRSSDDNRQVGAAIVSLTRDESGEITNADVMALGMNEVPRAGGGFYWDKDSPDRRDQALLRVGNEDRAEDIKISALTELIERLVQRGWFLKEIADQRAGDLARQLLPNLRRTQFMDIGEMAALIDAARRGVAVDNHSMYVTTFPCHNCAKHIIAAGIRRVVYMEPYPKSRADRLYGEELELKSGTGMEEEGKVVFCAFSGVAPRQYRQLFALSERAAGRGKRLKQWEAERQTLVPLCVSRNAQVAYLTAERQELEKLPVDVYPWDKQAICSVIDSSEGLAER